MVVSATAFHRGKALGEADLHAPSEICPICGYIGARPSVVRLQENPAVDFLACPQCHGISASRMPTDEALADYYAHYYDRVATELVTTPRPDRLGNLIADHYLPEGRSDRPSILDLGGGDGTISDLCAARLIETGKAASVDIVVVDFVQENPRPRRDGVTMRFQAKLDDVDGHFDIVIASAILEHIPDTRSAFDGLMARAARGGLFYARTPYMTPFGRRLPVDLTFPAHVHDLGGAFWTWMAANAGVPVSVLVNGPSLTETVFSSHFVRTLAAQTLKAPARLLASAGARPYWPFYGGWQVIWTIDRPGN